MDEPIPNAATADDQPGDQPGRQPGRQPGAPELVAAALASDRSAVTAIYDRHADRLYSMASHLLGDRDEAADVTAEVFLIAIDRLGQLKDPTKLRP